MDYPKCPAIDPDLPCLQHAPEKLLIAAACVLVAAEGRDHIAIKVSGDPLRLHKRLFLRFRKGCSLRCRKGCSLSLRKGCSLRFRKRCSLMLRKGCSLRFRKGCSLRLRKGCSLRFRKGCSLRFRKECSLRVCKGSEPFQTASRHFQEILGICVNSMKPFYKKKCLEILCVEGCAQCVILGRYNEECGCSMYCGES